MSYFEKIELKKTKDYKLNRLPPERYSWLPPECVESIDEFLRGYLEKKEDTMVVKKTELKCEGDLNGTVAFEVYKEIVQRLKDVSDPMIVKVKEVRWEGEVKTESSLYPHSFEVIARVSDDRILSSGIREDYLDKGHYPSIVTYEVDVSIKGKGSVKDVYSLFDEIAEKIMEIVDEKTLTPAGKELKENIKEMLSGI